MPNVDAGDEKILEAGFDFLRARTDQILGHKLALMDALPAFFALISMLVEKLALSDICEFPKSDLESARNDVRSAINTVINLYVTQIFYLIVNEYLISKMQQEFR
jgi:hypothetical protein